MPAVDTTTHTPDTDLRQAALRRIEARREFWMHLTAFVLVNGALVATWFVVAGEGLFWPIFLLAAWSIGLAFHGLDVFRRPPSDDRIRREMARLDRHG